MNRIKWSPLKYKILIYKVIMNGHYFVMQRQPLSVLSSKNIKIITEHLKLKNIFFSLNDQNLKLHDSQSAIKLLFITAQNPRSWMHDIDQKTQ